MILTNLIVSAHIVSIENAHEKFGSGYIRLPLNLNLTGVEGGQNYLCFAFIFTKNKYGVGAENMILAWNSKGILKKINCTFAGWFRSCMHIDIKYLGSVTSQFDHVIS